MPVMRPLLFMSLLWFSTAVSAATDDGGYALFTVDVKLRGSGVDDLQVHIDCGADPVFSLALRIPVEASHTLTVPVPPGGVRDCSLTADAVVGQQLRFLGDGGSQFDPDAPGCRFIGVRDGHANVCQIQVESQETTLTVFKRWVGTSEREDNVSVRLDCGRGLGLDLLRINQGRPGEWRLDVDDAEGFVCRVIEEKDASYTSDTRDCENLLIRPGAQEECTVVNTKVVKMIEMLNRYGLVIMILAFMVVGGFAARRAMP